MISQFGELRPDELRKLHLFLRSGFGEDGTSLDEDVLTWKYFGRNDSCRPISFVMRDSNGNICAHVGATYARFVFPGHEDEPLKAMFPTDWLSTQPGAGVKLLNIALSENPILYAIGGTSAADRALRAVRCRQVASLPVMRRYADIRSAVMHAYLCGGNPLRKAARVTRDALVSLPPLVKAGERWRLDRITSFKAEDIEGTHQNGVYTLSTIEQLNHLLHHPRGIISGWLISHDGKHAGYALLSVLPETPLARGKISDCQLTSEDLEDWASLLSVLTQQLKNLGASVITSMASTSFLQKAFEANHYHRCGASTLLMRLQNNNITSSPIVLSYREGDRGYI